MILIRVIVFSIIAAYNLGLAIFIYVKRIKNNTHKYLALSALCSGLFAIPYAMVYLEFPHPSLLWARFAYIGTFILPNLTMCLFYFLEDFPVNIKVKKFLVYFPAYFIFIFAIATPFVLKRISFRNYGILGITGPLDYVARIYYMSIMSVICFYLLKVYNKTEGKKKLQIKYFLLGTLIYMIGGGASVVIMPLLKQAAVYTEFGPLFSFFWISLIAYAIIRYRAFDIDTVIHRTILWLLTSIWLILPSYLLFKVIRPWLQSLNNFGLTIASLSLFYVFLSYYGYFQPRIDHVFRRRKYDYHQVLSEIGERIGSELDVSKVVARLFKELKEILYIRNSVVFIQQLGEKDYRRVGSMSSDSALEKSAAAEVEFTSPLSRWLQENQKALEREQVEIDPQYTNLKAEALPWFDLHCIEVLIPVIMENNVTGLIGLGKKENLQAYTGKDIELLEKMGRHLGVTFDNALHHGDIIEKERMDEELKLGREIQMNLLPREIPSVPNLVLQGLMIPAKEIGGDYYDFIALPNKEEVAIVIGDVSGKGVGAGLLMSMTKATINAFSQEEISPKQILVRTNTFLYQQIEGQKFMTLLYFKWQPSSRTFRYSSAGHEHILVYHVATGEVETIPSGGFMLGMLPEIESFLEEKEITFAAGDKILLYTDGVTDADNQQGERFSLKCLQESFQRHSRKPAAELIVAVKDEVYSFIGNQPQYDDITLVAMEIQ